MNIKSDDTEINVYHKNGFKLTLRPIGLGNFNDCLILCLQLDYFGKVISYVYLSKNDTDKLKSTVISFFQLNISKLGNMITELHNLRSLCETKLNQLKDVETENVIGMIGFKSNYYRINSEHWNLVFYYDIKPNCRLSYHHYDALAIDVDIDCSKPLSTSSRIDKVLKFLGSLLLDLDYINNDIDIVVNRIKPYS